MSDIFELRSGDSPLLVAMPHVGTQIPEDIAARMTPEALQLADTDWHVDTLYAAALLPGCSVLRAKLSRYVVDLNRAPDDSAMYAGQANTGLVPQLSFDGSPLYREGELPDAAETVQRREQYWRPYHDALRTELERIRARCGWAVLWDAHSIRSQVPRLFAGTLPDLNFGTYDGASCAPSFSNAIMSVANAQTRYSTVLNGRFKGGYTTRHYGQPPQGIHAMQLELCQHCYLETEASPFAVSETKRARLAETIGVLLNEAAQWKPEAM